jgi:hypothetical protein
MWTVIARTNYDTATRTLSEQVTKGIKEYALSRFYGVADLEGAEARRQKFMEVTITKNPGIIVISSHGKEDSIASNSPPEDILSMTNSAIMYGKIGYFIACLTGQRLAPACVDNGALAILAFDEELVVVVDSNGNLVRGFSECLTKPELIYDGLRVRDAYNETINEYNKWIEQYEETEPLIADVLKHDKEAFKIYGNEEIRVAFTWNLMVGITQYLVYVFIGLLLTREILSGAKELYSLIKRWS